MGLLFGNRLKRKRGWRRFLAGAAVCAGLATGVATANPTGATVRNGQVHITPGVQTQIQQLTDRAIIDWQSFSIGETESVIFLQPSQLSVILNRVTGGDASAILGSLRANGNVFLINPNGILFGPNSVVSVGGLVASTLNVTDEDFLAGNYSFFQEEGLDLGAVVNQGQIHITDGGYAVLTGPSVINEGTILARAGNVVLASGEQATLNLDGRDLVHFALGGQVTEGAVLLPPGALTERLSDVMGVNPTLRANALVQDPDGTVRMVNSSGTLVQAGTVSADGFDGQDAGSVLLDSSDVTIVADGSVTSASGTGLDSDGGEVLVLSSMDGTRTSRGFTDVQSGSLLDASGGESGDGGFIEVSGDGLNLHGAVDLSADLGAAGDFLLDPINTLIIDGDNAPTTIGMVTTIGDQWFSTQTADTFNLMSQEDVIFDLSIDGTNPSNDGIVDFSDPDLLDLTITAGTDGSVTGDIDFGNDFTTYQGLDGLTLITDGQILATNSTIVVNGDVTFQPTGDVTLNGVDLSAPGGNVLIDTDGAVTFTSGTTINDGLTDNGSNAEFTGTFKIDALGSVSLGDAEITLDSVGAAELFTISSGGLLDLGTADIYIEAEGGGVQGVTLETTGTNNNLDLGSSDLTLNSKFNADATLDIIATGDLLSDSGVGFVNTYAVEGDTVLQAGGSILLPNLDLSVGLDANNNSSLMVDAQGGTLDLQDSRIMTNGDTTLRSTQDMTLGNLILSAAGNGDDILIDSGGSVTFVDGLINDGLTDDGGNNEFTGDFKIDAAGDVGLGDTEITVDHTGPTELFTISSGGVLDLGTADIHIEAEAGIQNVLLESTGTNTNLDLGSSSLSFESVTSTGTITLSATGDLISDSGAGFVNTYAVEGAAVLQAGGSILLPDLDLTVAPSAGVSSLLVDAQGGALNLQDSRIMTNGDTTLRSTQDMTLDNLIMSATGNGDDILIDSGGSVTFVDGLINDGLTDNGGNGEFTGDFKIDAAGDVSLGDTEITVDHTGPTELFTISSGGVLDLGTADIHIEAEGGIQNVLLESTGTNTNLDLGSSSLSFESVTSTGTITLSATGDLISDSGAGFVNTYAVEGAAVLQAGGSVLLPDLDLTVAPSGISSLLVDAQGGTLDLQDSRIRTNGDTTLRSTQDMTLDNLVLSAAANGADVLIDSGGAVTFVDGLINDGLTDNGGIGEFTGDFKIDAAGDVSLGDTEITVDHTGPTELFTISSGGVLDLGTADIHIEAEGGIQEVVLESTGTNTNLDLGSSSLTFNSITSTGTITLSATGDLISDSGVGFVNTYTVEGVAVLQAGGSVLLPDLDLTVAPSVGVSSLLVDAQGGALNLQDSRIMTNGDTTLRSTQDMTLDNLIMSATGNGDDILIDSGGSVTFVDGLINDGLTDNGGIGEFTGDFKIDAAGDVSLGDTEITVDHTGPTELFTISSGGVLDLGTADIHIEAEGGIQEVVLESTGTNTNLDLGSSSLSFNSVTGTGTTTISATGRVTSDAADQNPGTFNSMFTLEGQTLIQSTGGDVELFDVDLLVNNGTLDIVSDTANLNLGESRIATDGSNISFQAEGVLDASTSTASTTGQVTFASNTEVRSNGSGIQAGDIEIFGFDGGGLNPTLAVPTGVSLDLIGDVDLSILAVGDIVVNHTGGELTTERAGVEGAGGGASPSAIRSTTGSISITSDGVVRVGKGGTGAALIQADAADAVVSIAADQIRDEEVGGLLDILSGGTLSLTASTSVGDITNDLEVQAPSVIVDVSVSPGPNTADVTIQGNTDFLKVAGNVSDIQINELNSGNTFNLIQATNGSQLTLPALTIGDIYYVDENSVELNGLNIGLNQSVAVEAVNGDITSNFAGGNVVSLDGELLLIANGDIGDAARSITVSGGTVATSSTGSTFVQSDADLLTVGQVELQDHLGNPQVSGVGITAGGDIEVVMDSIAATQLAQDEDIVSTGGDIAIDLLNGSLVQADSKTIQAGTLAIRAGGAVGDFDGTAVQNEVNIEATSLVLDVAGDVILQQQDGDLALIGQATIGGETYNTTGAGGDLRVRSPQGGISIDADVAVGGQAALVTGNNLTVGQGPLPNSINVNGSVTAVQSIVLLSAGNIDYTSGSLIAPQVGLGAVGTIGSATAPVQLQTDELSTNPFEAEVNDPDGFTTVNSVSAVGVTVNQGTPLPDPPVTPEPTNPTFEEGTIVVEVILEPEESFDDSVFAQNDPDLIEDFLRTIDDILLDDIVELDPTRPPGLPSDEDFLQRKFRGGR
jgi:filamentous hemagglutinin family protein